MSEISKLLAYTHDSLKDEPSIFDFMEESPPESFAQKEDYAVITKELWTSGQRQASSIHEVSYRACFKPQLPNYFIQLFSKPGDTVYDPFSGRGTTAIEAALCSRNVVANDVNPLSIFLTKPRLQIPTLQEVEVRLGAIKFDRDIGADIDLSMFYHQDTLNELLCLKNYLAERSASGKADYIDDWIRMVATNRLTGHSKNFFSVYTLPPNQACSQKKQIEFNLKRNQVPEYKDVKAIILNKSTSLKKDITDETRKSLFEVGKKAIFLNEDAANTKQIQDESISLVVTSPPFLDVIDYASDNWLRAWFNGIDMEKVQKKITVTNSVEKWESFMRSVFTELFRIVKKDGYVAFEVGEVRGGSVKLEENIVPIGKEAGFEIIAVLVNEQKFSKTSNIWGVTNNKKGTNTNRIVLFIK